MELTERPLAIVPAIVSKFRRRVPGSTEVKPDVVLDKMERSFDTAKQHCDKIASAEESLLADMTRTPAARVTAIRDAALREGEKGAAALDQAANALKAELQKLDASMQPAPPRDALAAQLEGETRAALSRMNDGERRKALATALESDDLLTLGAVLRAPAMLSGMGATDHQMLRGQYRAAWHNETVEREARLQRALEVVERAGKALTGYVKRVAERDAAEANELAARRAMNAVNDHEARN